MHLVTLWIKVEVVPKTISDDQVLEKIHFKAGALKYIIMEIPLWPSSLKMCKKVFSVTFQL